ncbi:MAG: DNA adenine methylase [Balneola sp.]
MVEISTPLLRYPGSKFRIRSWIYKYFVAHDIYVESFGGAGTMLFYKKPSSSEIFNDNNEDVSNLFRVLRDPKKSEQLASLLQLTPYSRSEYENAWVESFDPVEKARKFIVRLSLGQKSKIDKSGFDTRVNSDGYAGRVNFFARLPETLNLFTERLKNVVIEEKDGISLIDQFNRESVLHFVDPEYLNVKKRYKHSFTLEDHIRLRDSLHKNIGQVILCGYQSDEYKEWYEEEGWERKNCTAFADGGHKRKECIWLNPVAIKNQKTPDLFSN